MKHETGNVSLDVLVQNFGSVVVLWPRTEHAREWFKEHVDSQQTWGAGTVCEPRYVHDIVDGMVNDGLEVEIH